MTTDRLQISIPPVVASLLQEGVLPQDDFLAVYLSPANTREWRQVPSCLYVGRASSRHITYLPDSLSQDIDMSLFMATQLSIALTKTVSSLLRSIIPARVLNTPRR